MLEGAQLLYKMYWHRKILMRRYKRIKGFSKPKVKRNTEFDTIVSKDIIIVISIMATAIYGFIQVLKLDKVNSDKIRIITEEIRIDNDNIDRYRSNTNVY